MVLSMPKENIIDMICKQINNLYYLNNCDREKILNQFNYVIEKLETSIKHNKSKYVRTTDNKPLFSPLQTDQYAMFLYFLSQAIFKNERDNDLSTRIYCLNKALHSVELYFETELPDIFTCAHPLGSIMGKAKYSDYFTFYQNCTVGVNISPRTNNTLERPTIGRFVTMLANSLIIGESNIGNYVIISANAYIKNENIPDNSLVFGQSPNLTIVHKDDEYFQSYFSLQWELTPKEQEIK